MAAVELVEMQALVLPHLLILVRVEMQGHTQRVRQAAAV